MKEVDFATLPQVIYSKVRYLEFNYESLGSFKLLAENFPKL